MRANIPVDTLSQPELLEDWNVADLLFDIPYFFLAMIIPPMAVVNEVLQKGVVDAGMSGGCKWKPFQLDAASCAKSRWQRMWVLEDPLPISGPCVLYFVARSETRTNRRAPSHIACG